MRDLGLKSTRKLNTQFLLSCSKTLLFQLIPANAYYLLCCHSEHVILFDLVLATDINDKKFSERKIHNDSAIERKQCKHSIGLLIIYVLTANMVHYG